MKKTLLNLLAIILAVSMVFTMAPLSMEKAYADEKMIGIDGVSYLIDEANYTAAVGGLEDTAQSTVTIPSSFIYYDDEKEYTVTSIRDHAFENCSNLTTVTIPESVTSIEKDAFKGCTGLTTVNYGGSKYQWDAITGDGKPAGMGVTVNYAKYYPVFTTINGVAYVLNEENEERMATVTGYTADLPADVTIPPSVTYENKVFTVTSIGNSAFRDSDLTSVTFAEGSQLTTIDEGAFAGCQSLEAFTIPEGVTSIEKNAFYSCNSMETITIPVSVTSIGENAFSDCTGLTTINYGGSQYQWDLITGDGKPANVTVIFAKEYPASTTINGVVYVLNEDRVATVEGYTEALQAEVTILPNVSYKDEDYTVTSIGESAFRECNNLTSITIPDSVKSIETKAFYNCEALETIMLPDSITSIAQSAFYSCSALETIKLPDSLESIESGAFRYSGLKSITIPASVTSIGLSVFSGSSELTTVELADGSKITEIPIGFLAGCSKLESFEIPENVTSIGDRAFHGCNSLEYINLPEKLTSIGESAFGNCKKITTITIPESVTSIGRYAFGGCIGLTTITIPEGVTSIVLYTFEDCTGLTTITIPESVTSIGEYAFLGCDVLTAVNFGGSEYQWDAITGDGKPTGVTVNFAKEYPASTTVGGVVYLLNENGMATVTGYTADLPADVTIPPSVKYENEDFSVKSIKDYAFMDCSSLKNITIPEGVTSIGNSAFWDSGLTSVTFEEGSKLTTIDEGAFAGCQSLGAITIPEGVTSIENGAFYSCRSMETISIPESVTNIGANAFFGCDVLTTVNFGGSKSQWDAITGNGKPTGVTVNFAKEDLISINGAGVALSAKSFTYNGKAQKPAIVKIGSWKMAEGTDYTAAWSNASSKNVGTYSVAVTGKGKYKDTAKASYQIVPKGTTLKKPKKVKKAVTVKWKKQKAKMPKARVSGYQIQLATNSAFTANTKTVNVKGYKKTSKKVKKLKGKTKYYVRIRTYMKSGGKTYYSPWSKVKTVRTK